MILLFHQYKQDLYCVISSQIQFIHSTNETSRDLHYSGLIFVLSSLKIWLTKMSSYSANKGKYAALIRHEIMNKHDITNPRSRFASLSTEIQGVVSWVIDNNADIFTYYVKTLVMFFKTLLSDSTIVFLINRLHNLPLPLHNLHQETLQSLINQFLQPKRKT